MVYQSLCGLMPLLAAPGGVGGGTQGRGPPYVKLTVPLVELTVQAMRSTLAILQDLHISAEEVCTRITLIRIHSPSPLPSLYLLTQHYPL